nr:hypothetical protein [Tanacetum cinerariifolium]
MKVVPVNRLVLFIAFVVPKLIDVFSSSIPELFVHTLIEKLSQENVSQEEALEKFKWKFKCDDEIKVLGEVNIEFKPVTKKLKEKLSQEEDNEEEALKEFNSTLDNILEKLSQEKDSLDDFYGFMYDTDDDASISGKSHQSIQVVVVQNNVHEEVAEEVIKMAKHQAEALSDQEVTGECLDDEQFEERRPNKRIKVTQKEMAKDEKPKKG